MCNTCSGTGRRPAGKPTYEQLERLVQAHEAADTTRASLQRVEARCATSLAQALSGHTGDREGDLEELRELEKLRATLVERHIEYTLALKAAEKAAGR